MKFLPRVCDPSLFSRLPGTQFPVSMIHSDNRCSLSRRAKTSKWYLRRIDTDTDACFNLVLQYLEI
jgi:hypothetical protein